MKFAKGKAYAKINLTLDVGKLGQDGYHPVRTVMQQISLCDSVKLCEYKSNELKIKLYCNSKAIPRDGKNNAVRAAKLFYSAVGITSARLNICLKKRIPVAGGLGGGSTDAACVLRLLNKMHQNALDGEKLAALAAQLGSDDAFFLQGGTALCEGKGEAVSKLSPMPYCHILVARIGAGLSAAEVYGLFDKTESLNRGTDAVLAALEGKSLSKIADGVSNMLENAAIQKDADIAALKAFMSENGALKACMSGSGSCVYGIFETRKGAKTCGRLLKKRFPNAEAFVATPRD